MQISNDETDRKGGPMLAFLMLHLNRSNDRIHTFTMLFASWIYRSSEDSTP